MKKRLFRPPEIFIFSLAVADFFIGSIIMPSGLCKVKSEYSRNIYIYMDSKDIV